jgi:hypothetical protein
MLVYPVGMITPPEEDAGGGGTVMLILDHSASEAIADPEDINDKSPQGRTITKSDGSSGPLLTTSNPPYVDGASIEFDGSKHLEAQSGPYEVLGSNNFTFDGWIFFPSGTSGGILFAKGSAFKCEVSQSSFYFDWQYNGAFFSTSMSDDTWYTFRLKRSGSDLTLEINGASQGTQSINDSIDGGFGPLYVAFDGGEGTYFQGQLALRVTEGLARTDTITGKLY